MPNPYAPQNKDDDEKGNPYAPGGGGGPRKRRNFLQNVGHATKSPLRAGGRALTSKPVAKTLDVLDRPVQGIKGLAVGHGPAESARLAWAGLSGKEKFKGTQAIEEATHGAVKLPTKGVAGAVSNFVADVGLDPIAYLTFGAGAAAKTGLRKVGSELGPEAAAAVARHGLPKAAKKGLVSIDEVKAGLARATASQEGVALAKGGAEGVAARELKALGRRGAGGMAVAGRTLVPGGSLLGRAVAAPGRAVAGSAPAQAVRTGLVPRARLATVAGKDAADRVGEAFAKSRAFEDSTSAVVIEDLAKVVRSTKATSEELGGVVRRALDEPGRVAVPPRLMPLVDKLKEVRAATTKAQLGAKVFDPAHLHDEETYLLRALTDAGRKALDKPKPTTPFARLSDAQRKLRQGGSTTARELAPEADLGTAERLLTEINGPLQSKVLRRPQNYYEHNAAKLVGARATRAAKAVAQSRLVDDLAKITDDAGEPLVRLGSTRTDLAAAQEQAALKRELATLESAGARQEARAVKAADQLTSAEDLAVAARVPRPRLAPIVPSAAVSPVMRAAGGAERAAMSAAEGFQKGLATTIEREAAARRALGKVGRMVDQAVATGVSAGERAGRQEGRQVGRAAAAAQIGRDQATKLARLESRRVGALKSKAGRIEEHLDKLAVGDVVRATPGDGRVAVRIGEREVFAHPEVAKELERSMAIVSDDEAIRGVLRTYDKVLNAWKGLATVPLVGTGFHARNAQGNFWNNFLAGVKDPRDYAEAARLQRAMRSGKKLAGRDGELMRLADEHGIFNRGAQEADLAKRDALAPLRGKGAGGNVRRRLSPLSDENVAIASGRAVGSAVENNARLAHFIHVLGQTGDAERAAMSVKRHLFDYADLTALERKGIKRVIPFWTFMRKNTPLQLAEFARQPGKFTGLAHGARELNEDFELDLPPTAAVKALTSPLQPGGLANVPGGGLLGAAKTQAFGKTIPIRGTEEFRSIPVGSGSENRSEALVADLIPLYGRFGKVSAAKRSLDEGQYLKLLAGLRRRDVEASAEAKRTRKGGNPYRP